MNEIYECDTSLYHSWHQAEFIRLILADLHEVDALKSRFEKQISYQQICIPENLSNHSSA